ncbi:MAG: translation initiation factor IF-2 [Candidatus Kapabacteria bacterium]|nr:translation initiation factor IF-2 [Candidatus Kapabacteria bacterium]
MSGSAGNKLFKIASQINIGRDAIVEYLASKGFTIENKPTAVLTDEMVDVVHEKFSKELKVAEKQREKVEKQRAARKTSLEQGNSVSIESLAEQQEREAVIEARLAEPEPVRPAVVEAPAKVEAAAPVEVEAPPAKQPEPEPVAEPVAAPVAEPVAHPVVERAPDVEAPAAPQVSVPEVAKEVTPAVGTVIDLEAIKRTAEAPKPEPAKGKPGKAEKPAPPAAPAPKAEPVAAAATEEPAAETEEESGEKKKRKRVVEVEYKTGDTTKLKGLTVVGKIDLAPKVQPKPKRERQPAPTGGRGGADTTQGGRAGRSPLSIGANAGPVVNRFGPPAPPGGVKKPGFPKKDDKKKRKGAKGTKEQFSDSDVERAIRATLAGMEDSAGGSSKAKARMRRRLERETREAFRQEELARESTTLRLSEFVTTGDLANMMRVSSADIIMKCMSLGLMVSINQRLDRDTITLIAGDYGFTVEFLDDQTSQDVEELEDAPETLQTRPPIVTIMGHVDHGKTSLLDYIRNANVVAGEAGGITQHIGAYRVELPDERSISFLDTPGHEAFTAMRARGAQVTDIVVLVVAADDSVMPQTIEAISHAQAANSPIVVAINKVDKPDANPDRIRQQLADHNVLVEDWGGKYQVAEISAKTGKGVDQLLEKILLEADILDLKANFERAARGTVIEAHVDKGRGNVVTVMVQKGTLDVGDIFVCGQFAGRVRAMFDERGNRVDAAGPSIPVQVTGFDGLPNAGDILMEMETDAEARDVATRRQQLRREQQFRGMRHMTLDDISAQISAGGVKELPLIVKADVSGSVEALSDSLLKLSTPEVKVRIIYKSVGAISESDIMLAAASSAVIVGFQVNISPAARKVAENESVDVRLYSIIYDCINEVQLALEGMLTPDIKEEITATVEVRAIFKISRLGTIAGCYVQNGKITRNDKVRVLRDGFEIYKGTLASLKRAKDDVREVDASYECGIGINGFNDIEEGDIIEGYKTIEVKRKLSS